MIESGKQSENIARDLSIGNNSCVYRSIDGVAERIVMKNTELSDEALEMIAGRFRMLAEPTRLRILNTLGEKELRVSELVESTGANQANISKHLSALLDAGIVSRRKDGLNAFYRVSDPSIFDLCDLVCGGLRELLSARQTALS